MPLEFWDGKDWVRLYGTDGERGWGLPPIEKPDLSDLTITFWGLASGNQGVFVRNAPPPEANPAAKN